MPRLHYVGIDVSARELEVRVQRRASDPIEALSFPNHAQGHRQLDHRLTKRRRKARVVLEATGNYHLDVALALDRAPGIEIMVANPRSVSDFAKAHLKRSKTDAIDAELLLEYARRMVFQPWVPPAPELLELRALARRCHALTKSRTQEKNRLHATESCEALPSSVRNDIGVNIRHLDRRIAQLEKLALELIARVPPLRQAMGHLISVKGIAQSSALRILAELSLLPRDMTARQWVAHCGLDPRHITSGSSVHRPPRVSKVGNKHLRAALYMPALCAAQFEPNVRAFVNKLIDRGKKPMQANLAVMRKLLHSIYGMLKHGQDFEGEKFFALVPAKP
ncbi:MAG: IS110 family transposase [Thermoanaerobaculia bacterium]|nr:IS110 family transposase [Thermoanaerobaculia bacterium]